MMSSEYCCGNRTTLRTSSKRCRRTIGNFTFWPPRCRPQPKPIPSSAVSPLPSHFRFSEPQTWFSCHLASCRSRLSSRMRPELRAYGAFCSPGTADDRTAAIAIASQDTPFIVVASKLTAGRPYPAITSRAGHHTGRFRHTSDPLLESVDPHPGGPASPRQEPPNPFKPKLLPHRYRQKSAQAAFMGEQNAHLAPGKWGRSNDEEPAMPRCSPDCSTVHICVVRRRPVADKHE